MTTLDRNWTTFSEPFEPSESKDDEMPDDEMPDDELSMVDVLKRSFPSGHTAAAFVIDGSLVFVARSLSSQSSAIQSSASRSWSPRSVPRAAWLVPLFVAASVATGLTDLRDISGRTR